MFTDIVGYTAITQRDEALAMTLLEENRAQVRPFFSRYNGREVKTVGDAFLVEFGSALEAVRCAYDIQQSIHDANGGREPERKVQLRIGIHLGDVIHSQNDVYGDAVNVASRIEPQAAPEGICISGEVYSQVRNKFRYPMEKLPATSLKNVRDQVDIYRVVMPWEEGVGLEEDAGTYPANRIAILPFASFSSDPDDAYFAGGVTDEIISAAAGISGLSVIYPLSAALRQDKRWGELFRSVGLEP